MATEDTVLSIIESARTYAQSSYSTADQLVQKAVTSAMSSTVLAQPHLGYQISVPEITHDVIEPGSTPVFDDAGLTLPDKPTLEDPYQLTVPDFSGITPPAELDYETLFAFHRPDLDMPGFDREAPTISPLDIPDAPELSLPEAPELFEVSLPDAPSFRIPGFDPERPGARPEAPDDAVEIFKTNFETILPQMRAFLEAEIDGWLEKHSPDHHTRMQALEDRLASMLDGGTALSSEIEQRLYDRARARNEAARRDVDAQATERAAQMGHTLPPGTMLAALQRASQDAANANAGTSAEIAIKQAELEQQNIQFAIQTSLALRQLVLNAALQYAAQLANLNSQALQYASAVAQTTVQLYNARVQLFSAEVDYFRAQAAVYEVELRAAFAELERYEALVRLEQLKGALNEQQVNMYRQRLEGERTRLGLYTEQIRGEALKLDAERAQIDAFSAEVQAYTAQVGAKEVEFRAYSAALQGDAAKVQGYASSIDAYRARIGAEGVRVGAEASYAEALSSQNRSLTEIFRNEIQAYGTEAQVRQSQYQGEIRAYLASIDRYRTDLQYGLDAARTSLEGQRLTLEGAKVEFDAQNTFAVENARNFLDRAKTISTAAMSGAQVYGDIAGNAVAAQNTMVSLANETLSDGE